MREAELWGKDQGAREACVMRPGGAGGQLPATEDDGTGQRAEGLGASASQPLTVHACSLLLLKSSVLPGC